MMIYINASISNTLMYFLIFFHFDYSCIFSCAITCIYMKYHVNNRKSKRRPCGLQCLKRMTVDLNVLNLFSLLLLVGWLHFFLFFFFSVFQILKNWFILQALRLQKQPVKE